MKKLAVDATLVVLAHDVIVVWHLFVRPKHRDISFVRSVQTLEEFQASHIRVYSPDRRESPMRLLRVEDDAAIQSFLK